MSNFNQVLAQIVDTNAGIQYTNTGDSIRGRVVGYHSKASPLFFNRGAKKSDISSLSPRDISNVVMGDNIQARFTIGFEVEKNELHRESIKEHELFCGLETDSSCGYEAVTHVLPLVAPSKWRNKVFDMMHKAEMLIDSRYSRCDDKREESSRTSSIYVYTCGGHTTISCLDLISAELLDKTRKYSGVILAIFRGRLFNRFCNENLRLHTSRSGDGYSDVINGFSRPSVALMKDNGCVEYRVVGKFESVNDMKRRYELFYALMDTAINRPSTSTKAFLKSIRPILVGMYDGDESKADERILDAIDFQLWINKAVITERTIVWLTKKGNLDLREYYDRSAREKHGELYGEHHMMRR